MDEAETVLYEVAKKYREQPNNDVQIISQGPPDDASMSIKEKGGNWIEANLDRMLEPYKSHLLYSKGLSIDGSINDDKYTLEPKWRERTTQAGYTPEQQQEMLNTQTINQWVDRRLKSYIKNDLGTTKDPIRELADQGITHIAGLGEGWEDLGTYPDERANKLLDDVREDSGHPRGGYATTAAGKSWEFATDWGIMKHPAHDLLRRGASSVHMSPSTFMTEQPNLQKLVDRDPNAEVNILDETFLPQKFGFDHLMDELNNALDPNFPQHLRITAKQLERMTVPDAVRLVAKINKYREDLAEKATVKDVAEFRQNFPAILQFEDGSSWHQLKLPEYKEGELPKGFTVKEHHTKKGFYIRDEKEEHDTGAVGKTLEEAIESLSSKNNN